MAAPDEPLSSLVDVWHRAVADVVALLRDLRPEEWSLPTDLPGWSVKAVAAHLAHLESELAGNPQPAVEVAPAAHVRGAMGMFTEAGPLARAEWPTGRIVDELESSAATRYAALRADPPADPSATAPGFPALLGWSWRTLLSNRPVDLWMHEQDVRRATGRAGGLDTPAAAHVAAVFARSFSYVLARRAAAPAGTSAVLEVTGPHRRTLAAAVGDDGRGVPLAEPPAAPSVRVVADFESWTVLSGGRRPPERVQVAVEGDAELAGRLLAGLAVTP